MRKEKLTGPLYCITAALIWGLSFVAQKSGAGVGTLTFNGIRLLIGGIVLLPFTLHNIGKERARTGEKTDYSGIIKASLICGTALFFGTNFQQHAFTFDIEAGKVAFITALYMILVPVFGIFIGKKAGLNVWAGVVLGIIGLYLICINTASFTMGRGEMFALICAFCFAVHILVVDRYCTRVNNLALSCGQFLVAGILSVIFIPVFEHPSLQGIFDNSLTILYAGIGSCALGFTFQIFGQKSTEPAIASLLMCFESVFAAIFGWLILKDEMSVRTVIGCAVMFAGVTATQITLKPGRKASNNSNISG